MNEKEEDLFGRASLVDTWIKSMGDVFGPQQPWSMAGTSANPKAQATMDAALKNWQAIAGAMARPESISSLLKGSGAMPEVLLKLAQTSLGGFGEKQQKMIERLGRVG